MQPVSVILADAQFLVREGLKKLLSDFEQVELLAEVTDEEELLEQLDRHESPLVIIDYAQPGYFSPDTIALIKEKSPPSSILVISSDGQKDNIYRVLEQGVNCYITKNCDQQEVIDAVKAASKADKFFCTRVLDYLLEKSFPSKKTEEVNCEPTPLSPREIEIVRLVAQGLIAKEIADVLNLSTHTIYTHRKNIMKKLQLSSASELMVYAVNQGWVNADMCVRCKVQGLRCKV